MGLLSSQGWSVLEAGRLDKTSCDAETVYPESTQRAPFLSEFSSPNLTSGKRIFLGGHRQIQDKSRNQEGTPAFSFLIIKKRQGGGRPTSSFLIIKKITPEERPVSYGRRFSWTRYPCTCRALLAGANLKVTLYMQQ